MTLALLMFAAYIAGSVNFAILVLRYLGRGDPRESFSGNAGVTNVYRIAGRWWAAAVLGLDLLRAFGVAALGFELLPPHLAVSLVFGLVLGNRFPYLHGFRGGKGVAAFLGFTLAVVPLWGLGAILAWLLVHALVKRPFLASFGMLAVMTAALSWATNWHPWSVTASLCTTALVVAGHRQNLREFLEERGSG